VAFDSHAPLGGARGDREKVERSYHPEYRRGVRRLAGLVVLAAAVTFCVVQDGETSAGVGRYIEAQRAALAGEAPGVTLDAIMVPANRLAVREGIVWSSRVATLGLIGILIYRRRRTARHEAKGGRRG
jgi:hypothetical protein